MASQTVKKHRNIDFEQAAEDVYGRPKRRRNKIEKVSKPDHWSKDFNPKHKLKKQNHEK